MWIFFQISPVVFDKKTFVCFPYIYIGKANFAPWQPCFSKDQFFFLEILVEGVTQDFLKFFLLVAMPTRFLHGMEIS